MNYNHFLNTPAKNIWKRIGIKRRSGVVIPLFSMYSQNSVGIGEIPDLKLVTDWCVKAGVSIIQLLPLNALGYDSAPYNSLSTFALEPVYIRLQELRDVDLKPFENKIKFLKSKFINNTRRADYGIKKAKLDLLGEIYKYTDLSNNSDFSTYIKNNNYWLKDYAAYKVLKEKNDFKSWEFWEKNESCYSKKLVNNVLKKYKVKIYFHYWLQWQLYEQMKEIKKYASGKGVLIMGDLPFLVSRDSADIWSHQKYFNLHLSAGAPPDMYFAFGQKWGMPTYNWNNIKKDGYKYLKERIRYAGYFYNMYRIDHFVGLFRIWSVNISPDFSAITEHEALYGKFVPERKSEWEKHGKRIIKAMLASSDMLPCAEDLGTVPECSYKTLREYGIPGIDLQRFYKKPKNNYRFVLPDDYRKNSSAVISTHDSSFFSMWWKYEAGTIDKALFEFICRSNNIKGKQLKEIISKLFDKDKSKKGRLYWKKNISNTAKLLNVLKMKRYKAAKITGMYKESFGEKEKFMEYLYGYGKKPVYFSPALQKKCIERVSESSSIFSIQLIQEYMNICKSILKKTNKWDYRINMPGIVNENNWSLRIPLSLEQMLNSRAGKEIIKSLNKINKKTGRC